MTIQTPAKQVLTQYSALIQQALQQYIAGLRTSYPFASAGLVDELEAFYGQISYHMGWVDAHFAPVQQNTGKLLRPTLLLLAYEAAGAWGLATQREGTAHLSRALPAAVAIELFHNFTLMHDDIEDADVERRHRPTAWAVFGIPFAVNTGDGINSLSRLALLKLLDAGVDASLFAALGSAFDLANLAVIEGQHLDLCFEKQAEVSVPLYLEMITRKTAALMACATESGARLGTSDEQIIERLRRLGLRLGIAFQVRDDLLGIWATRQESGKTPAGDISRRKKTLPILLAMQHASPQDQSVLRAVYQQQEEPDHEQVKQVLEILARTHSRENCQRFLREQCELACEELACLSGSLWEDCELACEELACLSGSLWEDEEKNAQPLSLAQQALADLAALIDYVAEDLWREV